MSLILRSEEFLETSLEDPEYFGWEFTLTNPLGEIQTLNGQYRHINMIIDIDTGSDVQQEQASITARLSSVTIGEPKKNWLVDVKDVSGNEYHCYIVEAMPDRTMGLIVMKLGLLET